MRHGLPAAAGVDRPCRVRVGRAAVATRQAQAEAQAGSEQAIAWQLIRSAIQPYHSSVCGKLSSPSGSDLHPS